MNDYIKKAKVKSKIIKTLVYISAAITAGAILYIIGYILIMGIPNLSLDLFNFNYTSENVSLFPALINTILMTFLSLLIAVPLGIFSAIYLTEYAKRGNKIVGVVRMTAETLSGIPSIVYGLFGFLLFVIALGWGYSILAGAFTLG
ncbi:MAG: phosphate ABC transporter, permease protein PstA, partial [Oscillospiraceae bacterium]